MIVVNEEFAIVFTSPILEYAKYLIIISAVLFYKSEIPITPLKW